MLAPALDRGQVSGAAGVSRPQLPPDLSRANGLEAPSSAETTSGQVVSLELERVVKTENGAVLCVIGPRPLDRSIVGAAGLPYERLSVGGVNGMAPWRALPNLVRFAFAVPRAVAIMRRFRPDVVLVGGGYVCAPVAVAAWTLRVPLLTLCVDVVPGWAIRLSARLSIAVATAFPDALRLLPAAKTRVTGYPVRDEFLRAERHEARRRLGLPDDADVVLAFGGSLGALTINRAVVAALPRLLPAAHVVHVTGGTDEATAGADAPRLPAALAARYHRHAFLDATAMADAHAAADLAICRAGAATMAELPVTGTPAVLVPGEFSAQEGNARSMAAHGAAVVILNRALSADRLADETLALLRDRPRLVAMAAACRALAGDDAAGQVAALVREVIGDV